MIARAALIDVAREDGLQRGRVVQDRRELGDREDEDQVEEELERRDAGRVAARLRC
jgi:hypothetical protein